MAVEAEPEVAPEAEVEAEIASEAEVTPGGAAEQQTAAEGASDPAAVPDGPTAPAFDLVRVERDGSALVAGTAAPGATVVLQIDGVTIAELPADADGKFVAMFALAPNEGARLLSLIMRGPDGTDVPALGTVAIAPTVAPVATSVSRPSASTAP